MLEVICNKAATCKIDDCGMKKPHWHFGCKPCHFDSTAKCVEVNSAESRWDVKEETTHIIRVSGPIDDYEKAYRWIRSKGYGVVSSGHNDVQNAFTMKGAKYE